MTDEDRFVDDALARAAQLLPDVPDRPARVRRARSARQRRRRATTAALTVLLLAAAGTGVAVAVHSTARSSDTITVGPDLSGELGATGLVVAVPGHRVRFCDPDSFSFGVAYPDGAPPPSDTCAGVDVVGVDLARLTDRAVQDGVVSGQAELEGSYADGVLHVQRQRSLMSRVSTPVGHDHPPCPAPAGGWAVQPGAANSSNPDVTAAAAYATAHPAQVQQFAVLRPSPHRALVYLLTFGDPAVARAALGADYRPDELCVARSRYSAAQIAAASSDPALMVSSRDGVESTGDGIAPATGQPVDEVSVVVETPAMKAAVGRHPAGLIDLTAWLGPVTR